MSFVYFVQAQYARKPVKIGRARRVGHRLDRIQTGCPEEIVLLAAIECREGQMVASELEARLHREFADIRIRGEWFEWHDDIAAAIMSLRDAETLSSAPRDRYGFIDVHAIALPRSEDRR